MGNIKKIYAWARPVDNPAINLLTKLIGIDAEHTYVTDYRPESVCTSIQEVRQKKLSFWYCYGDFHSDNSKLVPKLTAEVKIDEDVLKCICGPNQKRYTGTIKSYGIDGVCHQVTNQILYAGKPQIDVEGVGASVNSYAIYNVYGLNKNDWLKISNLCYPQQKKQTSSGKKNMTHASYIDKVNRLHEEAIRMGYSDEEIRKKERNLLIDERLGEDTDDNTRFVIIEILEQIDKERENLLKKLKIGEISPDRIAYEINRVNNKGLREIAEEIGDHKFIKMFDCEPGKDINLVNPEVAEKFYS